MDGMILGKIGCINITREDNTLKLDCVLTGENFCVNPSTVIFNFGYDKNEEDKEIVKSEANNTSLLAMWSWMYAANATNLNQLVGQPVVIHVENDNLKDWHVISQEEAEKILEAKEKEKD